MKLLSFLAAFALFLAAQSANAEDKAQPTTEMKTEATSAATEMKSGAKEAATTKATEATTETKATEAAKEATKETKEATKEAAKTEQKAAPYKEISAEELNKMIEAKETFVLIDANGEKVYKEGHIQGAVNLTPKQVNSDSLAKVAPAKDAKIVFYCGGVNCPASSKAAKKAAKLGYTNIMKFPGGTEEWKKQNLPLEKAS